MFKKFINYILGKPLLRDWVTDLNHMKQSSLISVLRGSDMDNGNCKESKNITKMLRYLIVRNIGKKKSYMSDYVIHQSKVTGFLVKIYPNNKHWVEHVLGAASHIKYNHPNRYVREYWGNILHTCNNRIEIAKLKELKRIERIRYIDRIYRKYKDIYTNRYV